MDIDVDTPASKRNSVLQATIDYFGEDNVLNIATFGTEGGKSAVLTACRGLGIDSDIGQYLANLIPTERGSLWPLKDVIYGNIEKDRKPVSEFIKEVGCHQGLLEVITSIEGLVNKRSIHASGVYIYNDGYLEYNAMMKAPNGQRITQFNMGDSDYMGSLKYDYLTIEALDKMSACLDFLLKDGLLDDQGSLKANYDKYLHPDILNSNDRNMWALAGEGEVLDLFQFSTTVGLDAIKKIKPTNLIEAAHANSLMRLMAQHGEINPVDKYLQFRKDISLWYQEMKNYSLTQQEQKILEKYLKRYYGVSATQEDVMTILMDKEVCNLNVKEANKVRKAIAKKKSDVLQEAKEMIFSKCSSHNLALYIWDKVVMPQAGYAFSINHTTPYTMIALQELYLYANFPSVYWNTACLAVNSGSLEETEDKTTDYGKIAKAIGEIASRGVKISLLDINKSDFGFKPDPENNQILFGLKGANSIGTELVNTIIKFRPYNNIEEFVAKVKPKKPAMLSLIKGGAFDSLYSGDRIKSMQTYLAMTSEPKKRITMQNMNGLIEANLIPKNLDWHRRVFNFNRYLKNNYKKEGCYYLDDIAYKFYAEHFDIDLLKVNNNSYYISCDQCENEYQQIMNTVREWIKLEQVNLLNQYNNFLFQEEWNKYAMGNKSSWEMSSVCFYHSEHELAHVKNSQYGIQNFSELPTEPEVSSYFNRKGSKIPIYKLTKIIGTCINSNKTKGSISLLTTEGEVIDVKFRPEYFALFNKQTSEILPDGKKRILEKSWFERGNKLMITGYRRGDSFVPKKYKNTATHTLYKIDEVTDTGEIKLRSTRLGQVEED